MSSLVFYFHPLVEPPLLSPAWNTYYNGGCHMVIFLIPSHHDDRWNSTIEIFLPLLPLYDFIVYIQTDSCILSFYSLRYIFFNLITYFIAHIIPDLARESPFS